MTKTKIERWRYMGRTLEEGKVFYKWDDGHGLRFFKKFPAKAVGSLYEVEVSREGDSIVVHGRPTWVRGQDPSEDEAVRLIAQADDRTTAIELEAIRAEKAVAFREIEKNLDELRALYLRQTGGRRTAFLAHIIQRVTKR